MDLPTNNTENQISNHLSWSLKRKLTYSLIVFGVLFFVILIPLIFKLSHEPTCADNKKNQDETGVDCGGSCKKICDFEVSSPMVLWSKAFAVADGIYNVLALVENHNINSESNSASYIFRIKDRQGNIITERNGQTFIPNSQVVAIFEQGLSADREVVSTEFEFVGIPEWTREITGAPDISIRSQTLSNTNTEPRLQVEIENKSLEDIKKLEVVAIIFDGEGNPLGSSRTFIDDFNAGKIEKIIFTWGQPFREICDTTLESCTQSPTTIEIITKAVPNPR